MARALADSREWEGAPFDWWHIAGILNGGKGQPPLVAEVSCVGIWSPGGIPTRHPYHPGTQGHRPSVQGGREGNLRESAPPSTTQNTTPFLPITRFLDSG